MLALCVVTRFVLSLSVQFALACLMRCLMMLHDYVSRDVHFLQLNCIRWGVTIGSGESMWVS